MNIITRAQSFPANICDFLRCSFEDFLFEKSDLALKLEKYQSNKWLSFFDPLEKAGVLSLFSYENTEIREAIREIKYSRNKRILDSLAKFSSEVLSSYIEENLEFFGTEESKRTKIIFIPVPSHKSRLREKGWNQAEDIAAALCKNFPFMSGVQKNILIKTKNTLHQADLPRKDRLANLNNVFSAKIPTEFLRSFFIIIDDVSTTGSTLEEAKKTLKHAGARHVICFSLARSGE